jgi:hypothetical protein
MKPRHLLALLAVVIGCALTGCSGGAAEDSANVNADVQTGTPPAGLDGAAPAGGGGGAPSTPTSTP